MNKYYKVNIVINDPNRKDKYGNNYQTEETIIVKKILNGFYYREIVTGFNFYPVYSFPVNINEIVSSFFHSYQDIYKLENKLIKEYGFSMIMIENYNNIIRRKQKNISIKDINNYINNFENSEFCKYYILWNKINELNKLEKFNVKKNVDKLKLKRKLLK